MHLGELAVAAVALHQLALAPDRRLLRRRVLALARVALLALQQVRRIVAAERLEAPVAQLPDPLHNVVEEGTVVGGHDQRAAALDQRRLQPLDRLDVEMVRRLVEHEQVRIGNYQPGKRGACLLATAHLER